MNSSKKRFVLVASTIGAVLIGGGIAVAFWTTTGSGTGSGAVGTDIPVTVAQNSTVANLVPGGPAKPLDFTVSSTATGAQQISNVAVTVSSVTKAVGAPAGACTAADFSVTQPSKPSAGTPVSIPAAGSVTFTSGVGGAQANTGAQVSMINSASNQDGCKGATLVLSYAVS
ncbi:MAG: hypothetical protein ABI586_11820 [Candidatus Nanopelagicales bacterium]